MLANGSFPFFQASPTKIQPLSKVRLDISAGAETPPLPSPWFVAGCGLSPPHLCTLPLILSHIIVLERDEEYNKMLNLHWKKLLL